jgi:two-component system, LytTR family, response regulator
MKQRTSSAADVQSQRHYTESLLVRIGERAVFVRVDEIDWIEAERNYLRLHRGDLSHLIRHTMREMEARLDPNRFIRIHRSTIVNIRRIKDLPTALHGDGKVILPNGTRLTLSRSYGRRVPAATR